MSEPRLTTMLPQPGAPVIPVVNWWGLRTLYVKEVRRFFKVQLQTIWAPAITTLMFLVIFTIALGRGGATVELDGRAVPFASFVAPGLIAMGMIQSSFANSSFSLLVGKIQGTIVDYLMPPLSTGEVLAGLVAAAVTRAVLVGAAIWVAMLFWPGVQALPRFPLVAIGFGLLGATLIAFVGVITSIWAEKFDHMASVTNFIIQPLSLLSGTFYSVDRLAPAFRAISHGNPVFYIISGFRYGFLGASDSPILFGALFLLALNVALGLACYHALRRGWRLKA